MKLRILLLGIAVAGLLTACPPPTKPVANGWVMDFRGGTINLDSSAAYGVTQDSTYKVVLQKTLERYTGLQFRLPETTQNGAKPQVSVATGVSFYMALKQNGNLPSENATLEFRGPQKAYSFVDQNDQPTKPVYSAGSSFLYSQIQSSQGSGVYRAQAEVSTGIVSSQTNINVADVLVPPWRIDLGASQDGTLAVEWVTIPNAKSYLAIIYDMTAKKTVWTGVGKGNLLEIISGLTLIPTHTYDLTVSAFNFEINDSPKAPALIGLESAVNSVIFRQLIQIGVPEVLVARKNNTFSSQASNTVHLSPSGQLNGKAVENFRIVNSGYGALRYELELPNDSNLIVKSSLHGVLQRNQVQTFEIETPCGANESERTVTGQLKTNASTIPNRPIIFQVECLRAVTKATELWRNLPGIDSNYYALSPDGTKLLLVSNYEGLRIWDIPAGRMAYSLSDISISTYPANAMAWKPDGTAFAYISNTKLIIRDALNFNQLLSVNLSPTGQDKILWSPDGSKILAFGSLAQVFSATTGATMTDIQQWVSSQTDLSVKWSPNSTQIAATDSSRPQDLTIWSANTGAVIRRIDVNNTLQGVAWSADSTQVAAGNSNQIQTWDISSGQEQPKLTITLTGPYISPGFYLYEWDSSNQRFLAYFNGKLRTINSSGVTLNEFPSGIPSLATGVQRFAVRTTNSNNESQFQIFALDTGSETALFQVYAPQIQKISWHPSGNSFAVVGQKTARIFNKAGLVLRELPVFNKPFSAHFVWSRDGSQYATWTNSELQLRDSSSGVLLRTITGISEIQQVAWNSNSSLIAVQESTRTRVFNIVASTELWSLMDGKSMSVNASGTKILVRIGYPNTNFVIRLYDFVSGTLERTVDTDPTMTSLHNLSWSSNDNRFIALTEPGLDRWGRLFDLALNSNFYVSLDSGDRISKYQWAADAKRLFLLIRKNSCAHEISLASPISGDISAPLFSVSSRCQGSVPEIAISPDGETLVFSNEDSGLAIYTLTYSP